MNFENSSSFSSSSSSNESRADARGLYNQPIRRLRSRHKVLLRLRKLLGASLKRCFEWNCKLGFPNMTWNPTWLLFFWSIKTQYLAAMESLFIFPNLIFFISKSAFSPLNNFNNFFLLKIHPVISKTGKWASLNRSKNSFFWPNLNPDEKSFPSSSKSIPDWFITFISSKDWWLHTKWISPSFITKEPLLSSTSVSANAAETKAFPGIVDQMLLWGCELWKIERYPPLSGFQWSWKSSPIWKIWWWGSVLGLGKRFPWATGRGFGEEGKGLLRRLWCFLDSLKEVIIWSFWNLDFEERASLESLFQSKIQDLILISGYILKDFAQGMGKGLEINGEFFWFDLNCGPCGVSLLWGCCIVFYFLLFLNSQVGWIMTYEYHTKELVYTVKKLSHAAEKVPSRSLNMNKWVIAKIQILTNRWERNI